MKKEWKNADISVLEIQATERADRPITGVDNEYLGEDGRIHFEYGVAYNSGSATSLIVTGKEPVEVTQELLGK